MGYCTPILGNTHVAISDLTTWFEPSNLEGLDWSLEGHRPETQICWTMDGKDGKTYRNTVLSLNPLLSLQGVSKIILAHLRTSTSTSNNRFQTTGSRAPLKKPLRCDKLAETCRNKQYPLTIVPLELVRSHRSHGCYPILVADHLPISQPFKTTVSRTKIYNHVTMWHLSPQQKPVQFFSSASCASNGWEDTCRSWLCSCCNRPWQPDTTSFIEERKLAKGQDRRICKMIKCVSMSLCMILDLL